MADPETGFRHNQSVFGRDSPGQGVLYFIGRECVEAAEGCKRPVAFEGELAIGFAVESTCTAKNVMYFAAIAQRALATGP